MVQQQKRLIQTSPAACVAKSESHCKRLNCMGKQGQAVFGIAPEILIKTYRAWCEVKQKVGGKLLWVKKSFKGDIQESRKGTFDKGMEQ